MQKGCENDSPHLRDTTRAMPCLYRQNRVLEHECISGGLDLAPGNVLNAHRWRYHYITLVLGLLPGK